jgi:hypothetical protein
LNNLSTSLVVEVAIRGVRNARESAKALAGLGVVGLAERMARLGDGVRAAAVDGGLTALSQATNNESLVQVWADIAIALRVADEIELVGA